MMDEWDREAQALIDAARSEPGLWPEEHARYRARLVKRLGSGLAAGAVIESIAPPSSSAALASSKTAFSVGKVAVFAKIIAGVSVVAIAVGVYSVERANSRPTTAVTTSTKGVAPANRAESAPRGPSAAVGPSADRTLEPPAASVGSTSPADESEVARTPLRPSTASAPSSSSKSSSTFTADVNLLRNVHQAIAEGRAAQALALLDVRRTQAPEGAFAPERAAARVVALCRLGRTAEARAEAERFLASYPRSPLGERVRHTCSATDR